MKNVAEETLSNERETGATERLGVALGIFAYNEAATISNTLDQLTAMNWGNHDVEAFILANGCTDDTVERARAHLAINPKAPNLNITVVETPTKGKSATWNHFVHELAAAETSVFAFADCDLEFGAPDVIGRMIGLLSSRPHALCAVSLPTKLIDEWSTRFASIAARGPATYDNATSIAGSLYCLRANFARRFQLPDGLPGEDGFLRAMVVTNLFTETDDTSRIASDADIRHYFRPVSTLREWYRHERRLLTGSTINYFIYQELWKAVGSSPSLPDAAHVLQTMKAADAAWLPALVRQHTAAARWVIPGEFMKRRFRDVSGQRLSLASLPRRLAMTALDWTAAVGANRLLHNGKGVGHW